jgi:hypothetical protein
MMVEEFLHRRGTDLPAVVASVRSAITPGNGDQFLAVGSLAEGLGNIKSDLDLWLITDRLGPHPSDTDEITVVAGRCVVDVKIFPASHLRALTARLAGWAEGAWDTTTAAKFSPDERTLLHRLRTGMIIAAGFGEDPPPVPRPHPLHLARLKLHVARHMGRTIQVDMAGYRDEGDFRTLVYAAQELLGHATDALLAGHLLTNPTAKWRSRLLDAVPPDWEDRLAVWPTGLTAGQRVWELHRPPADSNREAALEYAYRITNFARGVFVWAEQQLVAGKAEPLPRGRAPVKSAVTQGTLLLPLDLDVDYSLRDDHVLLGRLNEFAGAVRLTPAEFALCLLFDGRLAAPELDAVALGPAGSAAQLAARLGQADLTHSPGRSRHHD